MHVAASIVGSPEWTLPRANSPHHHPDRFFPAAVLSQAAENDEYVPAGPIRQFHARLGPWYAEQPERISTSSIQERGISWTPELNTESSQRLVAWFQRWLPRSAGQPEPSDRPASQPASQSARQPVRHSPVRQADSRTHAACRAD